MSVNLVKQWFPQLLTALDRAPMAGLLCATALLFGVTLAWTRASPSATTLLDAGNLNQTYSSEILSADKNKANRLCEGGEISNHAGYFIADGNRLTFVSTDNKQRFITLENSNLERVVQTIAHNDKQAEWIVSGTISEFRGGNFILLNRVELKSP